MRIINSKSEIEALQEPVGDWNYVFVSSRLDPDPPTACITHDHWLGSSRDGRLWVLSITAEGEFGEPVAALLQPPRRDPGVIANILLSVHVAEERNLRDEGTIGRIVAAFPFTDPLTDASYFPEAPEGWQHLPVALSVDLDLSEDISVSSNIVAEFSRDTLLEAIRTLYEPRHWGLLFSYSLVVLGALPLLEWDVDWPLARRGGDGPTRRGKVQGDLPWEYEANCALLTIYQWAPSIGSAWAPHHFAKLVIRLRVGGRTPNEAVSNWLTSAKALRRLRRSLRAETIQ